MKRRSYQQLTQEQQYQIYALKKAGHGPTTIARILEVHPSTIGHELKRNAGQRGYRAKQAHGKAQQRQQERAARPRKSTIAATTWHLIEQKLQHQWSPEQICGWLKKQHNLFVSHERIYQHVYRDKRQGGLLYRHLRCQKQRRKRYASGQQRRGHIANRRSIEQRPTVVEERSHLGDWEVDTIIGKGHQQALVSLTERKSRLVLLRKVEAKTATAVQQAVLALFSSLHQPASPTKPTYPVHTITADNGREFARHEHIAQALGADFFFAHPYASWERGSNENANGLVRQYFPKGCDFTHISDQEVTQVMQRLNHRPRKTLDFLTPHQVFYNQDPIALTP
jgi:transposase, IS30 family